MNLLNYMKSKGRLFEFFKFVLVGGTCTVIHYAIYYTLEKAGIYYNAAYTLGYFLSFIVNFFASNYFTFNTKPNTTKGIKFAGAHIFNYLLQLSLLNFFIFLGLNKSISPVPVFAIAIPVNFLLVRTALKNKG